MIPSCAFRTLRTGLAVDPFRPFLSPVKLIFEADRGCVPQLQPRPVGALGEPVKTIRNTEADTNPTECLLPHFDTCVVYGSGSPLPL